MSSDSLDASSLLNLIFKYITKLSQTNDYDETIDVLAQMGSSLSGANRCSVWIVDKDANTIHTKIAQGLGQLTLQKDEGIVGWSICNDESVVIEDVYKDSRFNTSVDSKSGFKTKSMMVVPMKNKESQIIGAFQVLTSHESQKVFDQRDLERLTLATTYAAQTLENIELLDEIESTQKEVVYTMGAIAESRSKETANHVKRVAAYSELLALKYGLSQSEAKLLRQASPMHDIGKVAIADSILNKPGAFTQQEREIMQEHSRLGYEMTKGSDRAILKTASVVAYEHHEKYDGTGYPQGLKGDEIHIYGRITALADVFDALGSDRCYKKAWSDDKIFTLIKEEREKHFDPKLVDIFFENIDEILAIRQRYRDEFE